MVAVFVRLRFRQLVNSVRRSPVQLIGLLILLGYGVAATVFVVDTLFELRSASVQTAGVIIVIGGSIITLGFLVIPLFFGADDPADPRSFRVLGLSIDRIAIGLALSSIISVPAILLIIAGGAQIGVWGDNPDVRPIAVFGTIIAVATCVLGARLSRSIAAVWLHSKRSRGLAGLVGLGVLLVATPALLGLAVAAWNGELSIAGFAELAGILGSTPFGIAWSVPFEAAAGDLDGAAEKLVLAAGFALLLALCWRILVGRMLLAPHEAEPDATRGGLGWFALLPATPAWAIAAREFTYWMRDGRYRIALFAIPIVPVLLVAPFFVAGVWWQNLALIPLPVMCLFLSWIIHNDTASDNTAVWLHIASHTSGWADRFGRTVPALAFGLPLIAVGAPITAWLYGVPDILPAVFGVSLCVLLSGLGLSSYVSARHPYPTVRPGDSPFAQPQSTSAAPGQALSFFGTIVLTSPVLALSAMGLVAGEPWIMGALWGGLAIGLCTYYLGMSAGARAFMRRGPELLAFTLRS